MCIIIPVYIYICIYIYNGIEIIDNNHPQIGRIPWKIIHSEVHPQKDAHSHCKDPKISGAYGRKIIVHKHRSGGYLNTKLFR